MKCQCNLELLLGCHLLLETLMSMNNTPLSQHKVAEQPWLQHNFFFFNDLNALLVSPWA